MRDASRQRVRPAEQFRGLAEVARLDALADARTADALAVDQQGFGFVDGEAEALAIVLEVAKVALAVLAEMEIVADDEVARIEPLDENPLHEFIGALAGQPGVEPEA